METIGYLEPECDEDVQKIYASLGVPAQELVHEIAVAMEFDRDEYTDRVDSAVVRRARDAVFGVLLRISSASMDRFQSIRADPMYESYTVVLEGSDNVPNVAWHVCPVEETIVAATYQDHRDAAIATLRRIAWNRIYVRLLDSEAVRAED